MLPNPLDDRSPWHRALPAPRGSVVSMRAIRARVLPKADPQGSDHDDTRQLCGCSPLDGSMLRSKACKAHPSLCPVKSSIAAVQRRGTQRVDACEAWLPHVKGAELWLAGRAGVVLRQELERGATKIELQCGALAGAVSRASGAQAPKQVAQLSFWYTKACRARVDNPAAATLAVIDCDVAHAHRCNAHLPEAILRLEHGQPLDRSGEAGRIVAAEDKLAAVRAQVQGEVRQQPV